jgi:DNA-binding transcriptional MerR regulator/effector-binding domain-containing protein
MFTVGGFARIAGISAKVLRAYDAAGLFAPAWVDASSRYRYYSPAQLPNLRRILALRDVGLSRAEIGALIGGGGDLRATLERRRRELEAERRELDRRLAILDIRVGRDDASPEGVAAGPASDVVVRGLAAEIVATLDPRLAADDDIATAFHELEAHVRDSAARAHRPPGALPDEDLIFVPLRRAIPATGRIGVRRLRATTAATILHHGGYARLPAAIDGLRGWIAAAGHEPAGPLRILYLQFGAEPDLRLPRGWTVQRDDDFVTELQLPIDDGSAAGGGQIGGQPASFEKVS